MSDVEPNDFVRFLEYAYRQNYTVPTWTHDERADTTGRNEGDEDELAPHEEPPPPPPADEAEPVPEDAMAESADWGWSALSKKSKRRKKFDKRTLQLKFRKRKYLVSTFPDFSIANGYQPKPNSSANQDYTPVFLAHARLYTFAEMRLIYPLRDLALDKLHRTLGEFQLYAQRVGDVVELARYAYKNGPDRSESGELDGLRQLVVEYMAREADTIGENPKFKVLLEEGGEFVGDFWGLVSKYML